MFLHRGTGIPGRWWTFMWICGGGFWPYVAWHLQSLAPLCLEVCTVWEGHPGLFNVPHGICGQIDPHWAFWPSGNLQSTVSSHKYAVRVILNMANLKEATFISGHSFSLTVHRICPEIIEPFEMVLTLTQYIWNWNRSCDIWHHQTRGFSNIMFQILQCYT